MTIERPPWSKRSLTAQAMGHVDPITKAIVPPIHVATTYIRDEDNAYSSGFAYGRPDNATIREAEGVLAMLEDAPAGAMLFSSGMAAATTVFQALAPGDHVVAPKVMYWALRNWLATETQRFGLGVDFVETDDLDELRQAVLPQRTKLVWIETPSNPLWSITDIAAAAEIAHAAGALLAVDSTCASPFHTRPLALGADIVMHAATKVLNGHSDVVAGVLAGARDDAFWARLATIRKSQGAILGPFEAYLLMRGLRTLHLRAAAQAHSALALAERLSRPSEGRTRSLSGPAAASRATISPPGRWKAASASCCRSSSPAARRRRLPQRHASASGNGRPRSAASKASSSTAPRSRGRARPARRTSCACRSASRIPKTFIGIWTRP